MQSSNLQPPFMVVFYYFMGECMEIGTELEQIRLECGLSIVDVCNILGLTCESEYNKIRSGEIIPNTYQLIMFICATHRPLKSINYRFEKQ